jgi:hypothetical protein
MESLRLAGTPAGNRFRADCPGYAALARFAAAQQDMFYQDEEPVVCFCGD